MKILTVIGARPQFIKAAAISRAITNKFSDKIQEVIVHTGQHYDEKMSNIFFNELKIPREKYNLQIGSGTQAEQTAKMMIEIEKVITKEKPDALLLYGDTNSTLAACLVAIKLHIPIIHVEAGVRFYSKEYPEEVNRIICDSMSSLLFVPTDDGIRALQEEGYDVENKSKTKASADSPKVYRCGDIMYDNTLYFKNKILSPRVFEQYNIPQKNYILATMHRPANVDKEEHLIQILSGLNNVANQFNKSIILPLHPRTKKNIENSSVAKELISNDNFYIIPPASFLEMIDLEKNADLIVTDSGGVQKEAYFIEKPCLIMLNETAWVELVDSGNAVLTGNDRQKIEDGAKYFFEEKKELKFVPLYGDGKASEFICQKIIENF